MPICKKCGNEWKRKVKYNGVVVEIKNGKSNGSRKFCYDCSPLGVQNNRDLSRTDQMFPVINGKRYYSEQGKFLLNAKNYWTATNRKKVLVDMKGGCCSVCKYNKSLRALHFHHLRDKKFGLNYKNLMHKPWDELVSETNKCIVLCGNCHAEEHDQTDEQQDKYAAYRERYMNAGLPMLPSFAS